MVGVEARDERWVVGGGVEARGVEARGGWWVEARGVWWVEEIYYIVWDGLPSVQELWCVPL